jgi:hypothetical protein
MLGPPHSTQLPCTRDGFSDDCRYAPRCSGEAGAAETGFTPASKNPRGWINLTAENRLVVSAPASCLSPG